jgi:rRNA maturation endonuclease Nob1
VLLAKWVAKDGKVIEGETEDFATEGLEQRLSELERRMRYYHPEEQSKTSEIALAWRCTKCERVNSSQAKTCNKCGSKRPD